MSRDDTYRAFFALLPDDRVREALAAVAARLPSGAGRKVSPANWHLTLAFIGDADIGRLACLHERASATTMPALTLCLDRLGGFDGSRVWWCGPQVVDEPLLAWVRRLETALEPCGYRSRQAFRAHVTLIRGARGQPPAETIDPIRWEAHSYALMASRPTPAGVRYEVLARYPEDAGMPLSAGASVG